MEGKCSAALYASELARAVVDGRRPGTVEGADAGDGVHGADPFGRVHQSEHEGTAGQFDGVSSAVVASAERNRGAGRVDRSPGDKELWRTARYNDRKGFRSRRRLRRREARN